MTSRKTSTRRKRTRQVLVRLTTDEHRALVDYARRHDVSMSDAMRALAFAQLDATTRPSR